MTCLLGTAAAFMMRPTTPPGAAYEQEWRQQRAAVIAEFAVEDTEVTMDEMAAEILRYRHVMVQLANAVAWTRTGAPFATLGPGPYRQPQLSDLLDAPTAAQ